MKPNSIVRLVLPDVKDLLRDGSVEDIREALDPFHSADIADLLEELEDEEARRVLEGLEDERRIESFEQLEPNDQDRIFEGLSADAMADLVEAMSADDRADLIGRLPGDVVSGVLHRLPAEEAKDVATLAGYGDETAGGLMTSEFVRLSPGMSIGEAIDRVREQATSKETIYALYVLDEDRRLQGVVSLGKLVLARPAETKVGEIMYPNPISVRVEDDQETVMSRLRHYDFLAMPVLDEEDRMVGIVTHDDALDVAFDEATEDAQMMGGVQPLEAPYFDTAVVTLVRKRATWLTVLFMAGLVAGSILRGFSATLQGNIALVFFLPLIIAAGGNTGSQSASLVIRGLATGEMNLNDWWRVSQRELLSGLMLGSLLGTFGVIVSQVGGMGEVSTTVFATLITIVTVGSLLGSLLPMGLARLGIDPAITSSPLVAGLVDILGILTYVLMAGALLLHAMPA